jgi:predicted Zn-dependent protease
MSQGGGIGSLKYGIAAGVLLLYAGVCSWVVSGMGADYRKEAAQKADLARETPPAERPGALATDTKALAKGPEPAPPIAPAPAPRVEPTVPPAPRMVDPPPVASVAPPKAIAKAAPTKLIDPFWSDPAQTKKWDLDHLTPEGERELGAALHEMVLHDHPELDEGPLPKRLKDAAKPYLEARSRKDVNYTFTVLDCPQFNVFSHPGGYVYVCKGTFDWISEDEDHALGFILAHEIAHIDLAHAITCLRSNDVKKLDVGTVFLFNAVLIPAGYFPEQLDYDADRWVVERMFKAGRSRYEVLAFLRKLEDYAKAGKFEYKRKKPNDEPRVRPLDNHIRAHPIPSDRLEAVRALIEKFQK